VAWCGGTWPGMLLARSKRSLQLAGATQYKLPFRAALRVSIDGSDLI
jgi:hypothetical protein